MSLYVSLGGAGGDGGKGQRGKSNLDKVPNRPANGNAKEVYDRGVPDPDLPEDHSCHKKECCCIFGGPCIDRCTACTAHYYHILDIKTGTETCGGKGGNGGDGGPGGAAGALTVNGSESLEASVNQLESNGGNPGLGAVGGDGIIANSRYKGYYKTWDETHCSGICDAKCDGRSGYGGYNANTSQDKFCPGDSGQSGNQGKPWKPSF